MLIDGKQIPISSEMNITEKVTTGKRKLIEYLSTPV